MFCQKMVNAQILGLMYTPHFLIRFFAMYDLNQTQLCTTILSPHRFFCRALNHKP